MAKTPRSVAIYARISSDQDGTALGVTRQVQDCRALADSLGWPVGEEYVDNDVSAYSGKRRPAYERMLEDLASGDRDAVIVYHLDRLTRRPIELERFVETVTAVGVTQVRFVSGADVDFATGDGLLVLRMLAAVASAESAAKSRRQRRKSDEVAASGAPHGGSTRPYGYEMDRITVVPAEAEIIRTMVARFLAGESLRSITIWLNDTQVPTVTGKAWISTSVRAVIMSARIAGLRLHRGEVVGPAAWEPIITPAERDKVLALIAKRTRNRERTPRSYLLTGLLRCGLCTNRLFSSRRDTGARRYVCQSGPDHGGCGKLSITAEPVEALIAAAVLYRLDTPELAAALAGQAATDAETAALSEAISADRAQMAELADAYGNRSITMQDWLAAKKPIEARIRDGERRLARLTGNSALAGIVGNGDALRTQWAELNLTRQAAIVRAVLDHADIAPAPPRQPFDPHRVSPVWKI